MLALDYGSARCGCAVSDPTGTLATPIAHVERPGTRKGMARLAALVREREIGHVVVGLPLGLSGADTAQTEEVRAFAVRLGDLLGESIPIDLYDERFTTVIAERVGGRESEDSRAAAVLLEGWLARNAALFEDDPARGPRGVGATGGAGGASGADAAGDAGAAGGAEEFEEGGA
ncbi:MAG TPA: Holliday junction resolvase RuvX [Conexibacter sp.]